MDSSGLYVNVVEKTRGEGALGGGWNQSRDVKLITFPYQPMRAPRLAASLSLAGVGTDARLSCGAPDGGRGLLRRLWPVSCHSRSRRLGGGGGGVASKGQRGSCVSQWDHISPPRDQIHIGPVPPPPSPCPARTRPFPCSLGSSALPWTPPDTASSDIANSIPCGRQSVRTARQTFRTGGKRSEQGVSACFCPSTFGKRSLA